MEGEGAEEGADVLSLIRAFAQGDGVAQRESYFDRSLRDYSAVTLALLQESFAVPDAVVKSSASPSGATADTMQGTTTSSEATEQRQGQGQGVEGEQVPISVAAAVLQQCGPLHCANFLNTYWVLAYRARAAHIDVESDLRISLNRDSKSSPSSNSPSSGSGHAVETQRVKLGKGLSLDLQVLWEAREPLQRLYDQLHSFATDPDHKTKDFRYCTFPIIIFGLFFRLECFFITRIYLI